ncbi:hypothetical protein [Afipia clevelandensis]|uniref:hypothetical protein n=1 Tax=Afipia clevelandensis TaxID=1034 RepID=UPI0012F6F8C6|nr:hypothetical protein [Afipia clevelandensis]
MATHDDERSSCADERSLFRLFRSIGASGTTLEHAETLLRERYGVKDYFPSTFVIGIPSRTNECAVAFAPLKSRKQDCGILHLRVLHES